MRKAMLLKSYSLSQLLSEQDKQDLMLLGRSLEFHERQCLFRQGEAGKDLYIIRKGDINISVTSDDGREIILSKLSDGEIFGEIAMFDGGDRTADAWVLKDTTLISIQREDFLNFLSRRPHLNTAVILLLCKRLRSCSELLEDFLFNDALKRLVCKLIGISEKHDNLVNSLIEITQEDLAKMTGSSREVVNRNLQLLQDKGLLFLQRKRIIIPDIAKLKKIVGVKGNGVAVPLVAAEQGRKGKGVG
jgi:CRP-like cAMP-binding protein